MHTLTSSKALSLRLLALVYWNSVPESERLRLANLAKDVSSPRTLATLPSTQMDLNVQRRITNAVLADCADVEDYETKGTAAERIIGQDFPPGTAYDCALPQSWLDAMKERGFDSAICAASFIWVYPAGEWVGGHPYPLTAEARRIAARLAGTI